MKELRGKIIKCLFPVVLGLLIIGVAAYNYGNPPLKVFGRSMSRLKFKLGVDLVGGTILVYEIDPDKKPENYNKDQLISALKRRLDPADLYNITIRPLSDTRVEIILPTGGRAILEAQDRAWKKLLDEAAQEFGVDPDALTAKRNKADLLTEQIQEARRKKGESAVDGADIEKFILEHYGDVSQRELTGDDVERIKSLVAQVGSLEFRILANATDDKEAVEAARSSFKKAADSWKLITDAASKEYSGLVNPGAREEDEKTRNLTIGDISAGDDAELVNLILARNRSKDRRDVEAWLAKFVKSQELIDLSKRASSGVAPPSPLGTEGRRFKVTLKDGEHRFTYNWVELGKSELHSLGLQLDKQGLDEDTKTRNAANWAAAAAARARGEVFEYNLAQRGIGGGSYSCLMFSRKITNPSRISEKDKADGKLYEYYFLTRDPELGKEVTGEYLTSAKEDPDRSGGMAVSFHFNAKGGALFYELTSANVDPSSDTNKRYLAIVLDGMIMSAPALQSAIRDSGQITGKFTKAEVDNLVNILRSGALPATLKPQPVSENTMGATLGQDTIEAGMISIVIAFCAVLLFMLLYYRFAGFVACTALLANFILTIAFMVAVNATFTLPGLAGLVLMLAMAVDANILIYERLREERDRGASLQLALRNGYDRAFPTIIDTHLSSIFTAIVLYVVGNDQLKGFGISLTVGLLISLFTSLYMTRVIFRFWEVNGWLKKLSMARLLSKPKIDFMGIRKPVFIATVVTALLGLALFLARGTKSLNMDFVGGTVYSGELTELTTTHDLRKAIDDEEAQKKWLALERDPEQVAGKERTWKLTYKADREGQSRNREITLTEATSPAELRKRVETLPEPTIEPIYVNDRNLSQGEESKLFTVRTTEKSADLVGASIGRLLGDRLQRVNLKDYTINSVVLQFPEDKPMTVEEARALVLPALRKAKLIGDAQASDAASLAALRLLPLGGVIAEAARGMDHSEEVLFTGQDEAAKGKGYKRITLTFKPAAGTNQAGKALIEALLPLTAGDRMSVLVDRAQLYLTGYAYLWKVKSLLDGQLKDLTKQEVNVKAVYENRVHDGRYDEMEASLPSGVDAGGFKNAMESFGEELSARPPPIRLENFDSALAADMQQRAIYAIVASWAAMLMYLWFRFGNWTFGLAAVLCLIHDVCMTLGVIAVCHYFYGWFGPVLGIRDFKIDLQAVASLLTLIGFSVNDTIVVFDRIREVRGKNPLLTPEMINELVNQTLSRTILTSLTAWLVVLVLYIWGGEGVHLFAFVMVIGVIVGTMSSIFVASPLLLILGEGRTEDAGFSAGPAARGDDGTIPA